VKGAQHKDPGHAATDRGGSIATRQFQFFFFSFTFREGEEQRKKQTNKRIVKRVVSKLGLGGVGAVAVQSYPEWTTTEVRGGETV